MNSILTSIKNAIGVGQETTSFDQEIMMHINSNISTLTQVGVGPETGFSITDDTQTWDDLIGARTDLENVKGYLFVKTKLLFDPPTNASAVSAFEKVADEYLWRICSVATPKVV